MKSTPAKPAAIAIQRAVSRRSPRNTVLINAIRIGTVKKIDPVGGKVTIAHGPIPTMNWPAMNMTFTVKDKALLGKFSQDKKVEFEFVEQASNYVITSVK